MGARRQDAVMALSEYVGMTPRDGDGASIDRITRHHRWTLRGDTTETCPACGDPLPLGERHVLVTVSGGHGRSLGDRHYLCDETCLSEWVGE